MELINNEQLAAIEEQLGAGTGDVPIEWEAADVLALLESHQLLQEVVGHLVMIALECEWDDQDQNREMSDVARIAWVLNKLGLGDISGMTRNDVWKQITGKDMPQTAQGVMDKARVGFQYNEEQDLPDHSPSDALPQGSRPDSPRMGPKETFLDVDVTVIAETLDNQDDRPEAIVCILDVDKGRHRARDLEKLRRAITRSDTIQLCISKDMGDPGDDS